MPSSNNGPARNFFRLAVNLPLKLDVTGIPQPVPATLIDISEGGCKISSKSILLKEVDLAFEVPRNGKEPLKLRGKVRHIEFKGVTHTFDYGISYVGLRPADTDAIYQFVVEEQRRKLQAKDTDNAPTTRVGGKTKDREAAVLRVERRFPIKFTIFGQRTLEAGIAIDVSRGGMRVILPRQMPDDRTLELRFTLPDDVLDVLTRREHSRAEGLFGRDITVKEKRARLFQELRIQVKMLPGWHEIKGAFHYSVSFLRPKPDFTEEIERFLHAAQLTEIKAKRAPQRTIYAK
ncbi:MAG: PilZ domain-containing protein [Candidatus Eremiobacteraeota bacterium]|nr:PilZ domain-containing protein [Candidatus Eremiobacteraeota bacterium]